MEKFSLFDWKKSELAVVGGIIILIFGISYAQIKVGEMKTRDAQRKSDVELVARALDAYALDHKIYPGAANGKIVSCGREGSEVCEWGGSTIVDEDNVVYLKGLPQDPFSFKGWKYVYVPSANRQSFKIYIALEYKRDEGYKTGLTEVCGNGLQCNWYAQNQISME